MDSKQARNLVQQQAPVLRELVCTRCGNEEHLIPLALLYVNQRLSEHDWKKVRQYDGKQPFAAFLREPVEDALETFFHGVWFGKCAKKINYWMKRYAVKSYKWQDAEDYVKNKLMKDNFARFRSYKKEKHTHFTTYISVVIRNLVIDYLRNKTPLTDPKNLENVQSKADNNNWDIADDTVKSDKQRHLEEIGQWFFPSSTTQEINSIVPNIPDKIKLSSKERLFLRAMYKDGMTAEEAGRLPGINMGKWQAHGYHQRLKKRIKKLLKAMGYETLQSLLNP